MRHVGVSRTHTPSQICSALRSSFLVVCLLVSDLFSTATAADTTMYRWADKNGNPVVSDRPPPQGTPYTEISVATDTPNRRRQALRSTPTEDPRVNNAPVEEGSQVPALCTRARDHIDKLENAPSIAVSDGSGNVRMLSEEERASQLANAQKLAEQHCTDS